MFSTLRYPSSLSSARAGRQRQAFLPYQQQGRAFTLRSRQVRQATCWVVHSCPAPLRVHAQQQRRPWCRCDAAGAGHQPSDGRQYELSPPPASLAASFRATGHGLAELLVTLRAAALGNKKYLPMVSLFFCMSFVNTILDSIGNSLVVTATGGGASVLPFLTVYAVWPCSIIFLVSFTLATQRFSRAALFNIVICTFMAFYGGFGLLYPFHEAFHLKAFADTAMLWVPAGMAGAVGMLRNWSFTLFYCAAELWGDVVLSLLFWGLANELTDLDEAPMLYPLFGVGANVAQTLSGKMLSMFSEVTSNWLNQTQQLQGLMTIIVVFCVAVLLLHHGIVQRFPAKRGAGSALALSGTTAQRVTGSGTPDSDMSRKQVTPTRPAQKQQEQQQLEEQKPSVVESLQFLARSPQIQCLGIMSLSQGLTTNLLDLAWKTHLQMLHPTPTAYAAFMGEVAMWTGIVTGTLMCISPLLFKRWGWKGVAGATPAFLLVAGTPFFLGCIAFALIRPDAAAGIALLRALVIFGALLQVFGRGAKFSMFKPAEEMVYIGLDTESRTKGKAAIDVVGAQTGKSLGAIVQQLLLVICAGSLTASMPFVAAMYAGVLTAWSAAVGRLDSLHVCDFSSIGRALRNNADTTETSADVLLP